MRGQKKKKGGKNRSKNVVWDCELGGLGIESGRLGGKPCVCAQLVRMVMSSQSKNCSLTWCGVGTSRWVGGLVPEFM